MLRQLYVTSSCVSPVDIVLYDLSDIIHVEIRAPNTPYDPNHPIDTIFHQIQDAHIFLVVGGQPSDNVMIVNVVFTLVLCCF
jgi:hypothetical protein